MLPKINRLISRNSFKKIFLNGQGYQSSGLGIKFIANDSNISRFGLIISTKISKKAVVRNRLRRQIREIIKGELLKIKRGFDVVLTIRRQLIGKSFKEMGQETIFLFKKADFYD